MSEILTLRPVAQLDGSILYALGRGVPVQEKIQERRGDQPYEALVDSCRGALIFLLQKSVLVIRLSKSNADSLITPTLSDHIVDAVRDEKIASESATPDLPTPPDPILAGPWMLREMEKNSQRQIRGVGKIPLRRRRRRA